MTRLKQEFLHLTAANSWPIAVCAALCFFGPPIAETRAQAPTPPVGSADASTLRLVAEPGPANGRYLAGVDILMLPGSHTYWQIPGEAGVPPVFTFNGSENVRSAVVKFPVPRRITEQGIDAYGYENRVIFPIEVVPDDPARPAMLHVDASFAVCNKLCLPGHGEATLTLRPRGPGVAADLVEQADAKVPRPVAAVPALKVVPQPAAAQSTWALRWDGPMPPEDIFPVAPEGYVFSTRKTAPQAWTLIAETAVTTDKSLTVPVTLVLANASAPTQVTRSFELKPPVAP